jgi:cytochrome c peroxidase
MFNEHPVELGLVGRKREVVQRLSSDPDYPRLFDQAFRRRRALTFKNVVKALAAFERTLISGGSAYDRRVFWDEKDAMSPAAERGMRLFFSQRTRCSECHAGFNFSGPVAFLGGERRPAEFHNTGLFDLDGKGAYPQPNRGLFERTSKRSDMGRFRAPTLRNIELTAPYMHDGSIETLENVVSHYAAGGREEGQRNLFKSSSVRGFEISPTERIDLVEFLKSLTDRSFVDDPRFSDPF